ncbi:PREDICTED: uracil phosphoribosyltransferase homolog [Pygoscelis adeliae]|uniref:uracil phosphoribosyltransferase homolog n=1 Tax=Pygoscelis adeliae TaxID=9238 RepID=UPI0004F4F8A0|nr:PREDICTED: uracil phosphoribosyltransferase homolog [Pygoscelis adeliae]
MGLCRCPLRRRLLGCRFPVLCQPCLTTVGGKTGDSARIQGTLPLVALRPRNGCRFSKDVAPREGVVTFLTTTGYRRVEPALLSVCNEDKTVMIELSQNGAVRFNSAGVHRRLASPRLSGRKSSRGDFVFSADRLIRLVVEEGLNQLPYTECTVTTPTGHKYEGVRFEKGNCGVSIMRSGEAMEQGLRDCCRSIRIGKILIQSDEETQRAKVYYAKFPPDIYRRKVLLMYPILSTGNTVIEAVKVLVEHGVQPSVIILLSLFSTPHGAKSIIQEFPEITILTTEVHPVAPTHFGQKYFGTD